jgi:superfamily II DNA or RNA helicase
MQNERSNRPRIAGQKIEFVTALDLISNSPQACNIIHKKVDSVDGHEPVENIVNHRQMQVAIWNLCFTFSLKIDQIMAVDAWIANRCKGSIIYGSGTGKTEIALECARRAAEMRCPGGVADEGFNIVFLVPRKVLVDQNLKRLQRYGIAPENIGRYFGEQKQIREIIIGTYHSALHNLDIIRRADMVIFDEVHLARGAFTRIFDLVNQYPDKLLLGLTATIDENDTKNSAIINTVPPVRKYLIKDAVQDRRLARPIIRSIGVRLTEKEQRLYDQYSTKIRNISKRFNRFRAEDMMELIKVGGFPSWQAKAWFLNVKKRKQLLASSENKLLAALDLIMAKHPDQKVMVFSETLESVRKLKQLLKSRGIASALIDSRTFPYRRQVILSEWGRRFNVLLSVHTLEVGFDVPDAQIEIILATTSNMNQVVQRIGRVLRKVHRKDFALIYLIYVSDTKDDSTLTIVRNAVDTSGGSKNAGAGD